MKKLSYYIKQSLVIFAVWFVVLLIVMLVTQWIDMDSVIFISLGIATGYTITTAIWDIIFDKVA